MKRAFIVLCIFIGFSLSQAKWCIQNITTEIEVTRILTRTKLPSTWFASQPKIETYQVVERIPKNKQKRFCCDGYILEEFSHACVPTCSDGCPKLADCVEPNTCKCHPGYHMEGGVCRLNCGNCENGRCTDLGGCECNPMYVRIEDACKPICLHKCTNGFCSAPDKCECNTGYQENSETNRCEPICQQSCGGNAYCSAPDVCTCKYGFFGNSSDACQPWCKAECRNGQCVGPNNCACHQGFVKVDGLCIPDCQSGCQFGDCLDEGICQCWPGFLFNNSTGSCQETLDVDNTTTHAVITSTTQSTTKQTSPVQFCLNDCGNGTCIAGICHCREGFVKADLACRSFCENCEVGDCVEETLCQRSLKMKLIPSTEPSLSSTSDLFTSESSTTISTTDTTTSCENGCWAGTCVNGVCQCPDGLILNDENDCIMPCEATCKNGVCNQNNICECRTGFVHKNGTECVPQCDRECINSFCIAPNHCECLEGYIPQLNASSAHICLPTCDGVDGEEGCLNGTCVAVNKCQCLEGFTHKPGNRFECVPFAMQAEHGHSRFWYIYLLLGLLILLVMTILGLYALRKMHQDTYNVDKVEKCRGTVRYTNDEQPYCVI